MEYKRGIDVSFWQGDIDWETVKNSGLVDFAMIRAGYGQGSLDDFWLRNVQECTRLKIPFGVYWFMTEMGTSPTASQIKSSTRQESSACPGSTRWRISTPRFRRPFSIL